MTDVFEITPINTESSTGNLVCQFKGTITDLIVDAIVSSSDVSMQNKNGVNGQILRLGGPDFLFKVNKLRDDMVPDETFSRARGLRNGSAAICETSGKLKSKYVIFTNAPGNMKADVLQKCYTAAFDLAVKHKCSSIALPCLGAGAKGFPEDSAAQIAIRVARDFLTKQEQWKVPIIQRICFCTYTEVDSKLYEALLPMAFNQ